MPENPTDSLLAEINRFLDRTGTAPTAFGKAAVNDPKFVWSLRAGREPRFRTAQRVLEFIEARRTEGAS